MNIKKYDDFLNEEFDVSQTFLYIGGLYCLYKFWVGFFKEYTYKKTLKETSRLLLKSIEELMGEVRSGKDVKAISINDFNDRIFIRIKGFDKDIRIFKETKIVQMGDDIKIKLGDNDYEELIRILGSL